MRAPDADRMLRVKTAVDIRALALGDLNAIEEIERRSYPTPWSRSMFAGELAKPASLCLGAFEGDAARRLPDHLALRRRVARDEHRRRSRTFRRRGIATALLERLFELTDDGSRRGYTLEVRVSNDGAIKLYERLGFTARGIRRGYYTDNREDALIMWRDPAERRRDVILALETSCDETACALVAGRRTRRARTSSPRRPSCTRATAASCPRSRRAGTSSSSRRSCARRSTRRGASLDDVDRVAVTQGPGLIGALLVGAADREGDRVVARGCRSCPVDHLHGHVASLFLEPDPLEPPFLCLLASGGHTMLLDVHEHARWDVLGSTLDDAAGEAFDKGARLLGLGYPGGAAIDRLAREGDAEAFSFPVARARRARLLLLRREDGAALRGARPRRRGRGASRRPRRELPARDRPRARRADARRPPRGPARSGSPSSAASRRTRSCARRLPGAALAPLALCTDNAAMIGSAARYAKAVPYPGYLALDAYASAR